MRTIIGWRPWRLVLPESHHGIEVHRAACREITGDRRHAEQEHRDAVNVQGSVDPTPNSRLDINLVNP
jgi:hypothetical protein